ncbi:MAG: DNA glycosylase AlkZ-like family protein, partial [Bacteroidota bacterium]|nr:crosslink repair DNA glycosylase YcaQ family protein [Kiloniellaceae bacterium]
FVPAPRRKYGYYVFPLLEGDKLIGRLDMKHERDKGALAVKGLWLEPKMQFSAARKERLESELERQRRFTGAERVTFAKGWVKRS